MSHTEGGWPRDVNTADVEQKSRYRKKIEKDEDFIYKTRQLVRETEKYVKQNNCIDIYEEYFDETDDKTEVKPVHVGSVAVIKDPLSSHNTDHCVTRSINQVCWSPSNDQVALAFCNTEYLAYYQNKIDKTSLIYDINNPLAPVVQLTPVSALMTLRYNIRDNCILAGGTLSGHLVMIDTRCGPEPVTSVEIPDNRADSVTDLTWLNIRSGHEILTTVSDGR